MIATVDDALGSKTKSYTLESSHSPFMSQPTALSQVLIDIGTEPLLEDRARAR